MLCPCLCGREVRPGRKNGKPKYATPQCRLRMWRRLHKGTDYMPPARLCSCGCGVLINTKHLALQPMTLYVTERCRRRSQKRRNAYLRPASPYFLSLFPTLREQGVYLVDGLLMDIQTDGESWYCFWHNEETGQWRYRYLGKEDTRKNYPMTSQSFPWMIDGVWMVVRQEMRCCNDPRHKCKRCFPVPGIKVRGHGPYWYAYYTDGQGKRQRVYIGRELPLPDERQADVA